MCIPFLLVWKMVFAKLFLVRLVFRVKIFWGKIVNNIKKMKGFTLTMCGYLFEFV